jgi:Protein of unknown function (DUF2783)
MTIDLSPNISDVDRIYQALVDAHEGIDVPTSMRINARLILLLLNHIGDLAVIEDAIRLAVDSTQASRAQGKIN